MTTSKYDNRVYTGRVKWFNHQGWGFISLNDSTEDIFVRWDNLACDGYKYLVQGEYVQFNVEHKPDAEEGKQYQASNVNGVGGGKLMCETRHEQRVAAARHRQVNQAQPQVNQAQPQRERPPRVTAPVPVAGHQWVLVPQQAPPRQRQPRRN